jgi:hypothetical protein
MMTSAVNQDELLLTEIAERVAAASPVAYPSCAILSQFVHPSAGSPALQFMILGGTMKATGLLILARSH